MPVQKQLSGGVPIEKPLLFAGCQSPSARILSCCSSNASKMWTTASGLRSLVRRDETDACLFARIVWEIHFYSILYGTNERTATTLEAGYVSHRHRVAHCRAALLPSAGLGYPDKFHHGAGGICNGVLVNACDCGAAMEAMAFDAGGHMVRG